ncbi:MAG: helix-turn-helix transcriptional regulator [Comamonadaceae bacterium]|nr:helix-turn-helix transcriptional regulator [Comamonadaceae bacterium]MBH2042847.1 helix-turn-helix transcriptional regulator [Comamonadaceae bacterium]
MVQFDKVQADLAVNIKMRRAELSISQEQLALRSETQRSQISLIELQQANPTLKTLHQIAAVLDMGVHELLLPRPTSKTGGR